MRGGNAIAGWSNTRAPVVTPRLKAVKDTILDSTKFDEWITALLNLEIGDFLIDKKTGLPGRLRMLSECLAASLLMHLSEMIKDVTRYHCVVEHIKRVSTEYGYCTSMLMQWGTAIRSEWELRTSKAQATGGDINDQVLSVVSQLRDHIQYLQNDLVTMKMNHMAERSYDIAKFLAAEKRHEEERSDDKKNFDIIFGMVSDINKSQVIKSPNSNTKKRQSTFGHEDMDRPSPPPSFSYDTEAAVNSLTPSSESNSIGKNIPSAPAPIFNNKFIATFDSKAAGAGMTISMLLTNFFEFNLTSDVRWSPKDSSSQTKMTKVYRYALIENSVLKKNLTDLYKAMPEINTDAYESWRQDWCLATRAAEEDVHFRLCAEESEYNVELKILADARAIARKKRQNGDKINNLVIDNKSAMVAVNFSTRKQETPKLAATSLLLVYGVDSRLNYLATAKATRKSSSKIFFSTA